MNAMQKLVIRRDAARRNGKKGFTLVELIIVIAIMAALVAVLAPQYIKYVEKSREAADDSTIAEFKDAIKVAATDEDYTLATGNKIVISAAKGTATSATPNAGGTAKDLGAALTEYYGADWTNAYLKHKGATAVTLTLTVTSNGTVTIAQS